MQSISLPKGILLSRNIIPTPSYAPKLSFTDFFAKEIIICFGLIWPDYARFLKFLEDEAN